MGQSRLGTSGIGCLAVHHEGVGLSDVLVELSDGDGDEVD